jgi:glycosyltransferase involved in cell wall biosynthesis
MVRNISNRRKIPTVVHIMDDWISCKHSGDWAVAPSRRALVRSFEREIACATNCIAISAKMAAEYAARYGRPFEVIANAIDLRNFPPALRAYSPRRLRLGHVGRISAGRLQALKNVATALGRLEQRGWAVGLELVGVTREELPVDLQNSSLVHCCPSDSDEEIKALGQRVDALLQAESFDPQENAWFRHSLSAKLPLYLALGRPILAYGPRDLGSIAYVETAGCGVVVDSLAVERLVDLCEQFAGDSIRMERMGKRSREVAEEYHDRTRVCAMFRDLIVEAAGWNATTGNGLTASSGKKKHD